MLFPPHCVLCGKLAPRLSDKSVCPGCWDLVVPLRSPTCSCCGLPLESVEACAGGNAPHCGACLVERPPFERARAYAIYQNEIRRLIHLLKFGGRRDLAIPLGRKLISVHNQSCDLTDCNVIVPVPLHHRRRHSRGFNQAELLARVLARDTHKEVETKLLLRTRDTQPQSGLTDEQRHANTRGAFTVARPDHVAGKTILLIDDVYTTGATLSACSRVLLEAGAAKVCVLTVARVQRRGLRSRIGD